MTKNKFSCFFKLKNFKFEKKLEYTFGLHITFCKWVFIKVHLYESKYPTKKSKSKKKLETNKSYFLRRFIWQDFLTDVLFLNISLMQIILKHRLMNLNKRSSSFSNIYISLFQNDSHRRFIASKIYLTLEATVVI